MKTQTAFRLSDDLLKKLDKEAERQNRSRNNLVETILKKYLENNDNYL